MRIHVLDSVTASRIAAGEVIARPASVAKELIENALDAQSTAITIEIRDGGISYFRVTDNGVGIAPEDVALAFQNHATSKFDAADDVFNIDTLGFRGEALPSIASVSKIEMETKQAHAEGGVKIVIHGGQVQDITQSAARNGTSIVVRDLFYNMPARRDFIKSVASETMSITDIVTRMMLAHPGVAFRLINNSRTVLQTYGDGSMRHAALNVLGKEIAQQLIEIDEMEGGIRLHGWIGVEGCARATRTMQTFFINGRYVHSEMLSSALSEATMDRVMTRMFPICMLHLTLPRRGVNINVHPNKLEVKFRDEDSVRRTIALLLGRGLKTPGMMNLPEILNPKPELMQERPKIELSSIDTEKQTVVGTKPTSVRNDTVPVVNKQTEVPNNDSASDPQQSIAEQKIEQLKYRIPSDSHRISLREPAPAHFDDWNGQGSTEPELAITSVPMDNEANDERDEADNPPFTVLGVVFQTYVVVEIKDMMILIDQHAAHERLLYERYIKELDQDHVSQQLLTPIVIEVGRQGMESLIDNQTVLEEIGYQIEPFGDTAVQLRAVPQLFGKVDLQPLILSMLDHLQNLRSATFERRRLDIVRYSCKRAVKAGDKLNNFEIASLIAEMLRSKASPTCPHGRPVISKMTRRELERLFKRV